MRPRILRCDIQGLGEPVVLVPGALTGWLSWVPHQERLALRWTAIRVQPIHNELGSAGKPGEPAYTDLVERESLLRTLDELGHGQVHLAGWSGGGRAALDLAIAHPDRVRSLILVEPAADWVLAAAGEHQQDVARLDDFKRERFGQPIGEDDLAAFLELAGFVAPGDDPRSHPGWERWVPHRQALSWLGRSRGAPATTLTDLAHVRQPTLLVKGDRTIPWQARTVDLLGEHLPDALVLELPGDHACHIESMGPFLDAMEDHLARAAGT